MCVQAVHTPVQGQERFPVLGGPSTCLGAQGDHVVPLAQKPTAADPPLAWASRVSKWYLSPCGVTRPWPVESFRLPRPSGCAPVHPQWTSASLCGCLLSGHACTVCVCEYMCVYACAHACVCTHIEWHAEMHACRRPCVQLCPIHRRKAGNSAAGCVCRQVPAGTRERCMPVIMCMRVRIYIQAWTSMQEWICIFMHVQSGVHLCICTCICALDV